MQHVNSFLVGQEDDQDDDEDLPGDDEEEYACQRGGSCGDGDWCESCWKRYDRDCGKEQLTYSKLPQGPENPEGPTNQKKKAEFLRGGEALILLSS